jgi:hypothetical protein
MKITPPPQYRSYLLRCTQTHSTDPTLSVLWRFSLQDPETHERFYFPHLAALVAFLQDELSIEGLIKIEERK